MFFLMQYLNSNKPKLREYDPATVQRIKEGAYLVKIISETEIASRKCKFYSELAQDKQIKDFFNAEADKLHKVKRNLQKYFETMTEE